jgi:hypothetical protein
MKAQGHQSGVHGLVYQDHGRRMFCAEPAGDIESIEHGWVGLICVDEKRWNFRSQTKPKPNGFS